MQNGRRNWYIRVNPELYRTTRDLEHIPKTNKRFWASLKGTKSGPLIIDVVEGDPVFVIDCGAEFNGPTGWFDWESLMFAALVHDLLVEEWKHSTSKNPVLQTTRARKASNRIFRDIAKRDGSNGFAILAYKAIKFYTRLITL